MNSAHTERFLARFVKTDTCWLWQGRPNHAGYGRTGIGQSKYELAHRFAWRLFRGEIPRGLFVLHHCDVPACVNPDHLFIGTQLDNLLDMHAKGRGPNNRGVRSGLAKLTDDKVRAIRRDSRTQAAIAAAYRMAPSSISAIRHRKTWRHVE